MCEVSAQVLTSLLKRSSEVLLGGGRGGDSGAELCRDTVAPAHVPSHLTHLTHTMLRLGCGCLFANKRDYGAVGLRIFTAACLEARRSRRFA